MSTPAPSRMLTGHHVYRIVSQLNTDLLVGYCWCGAAHDGQDPVELWQWLLDHPSTHDDPAGANAGAPDLLGAMQ